MVLLKSTELWRTIVLATTALVLGACATLPKPDSREYDRPAMLAGFVLQTPGLRYFPESQNSIDGFTDWSAGLPVLTDGRFDLLALSSGGPDGAFSAGILNGWSESGTRPEFEIVTGVSTGTLIAPFAFVGAKYDWLIKDLYTSERIKTLLGPARPARGLAGKGLYSTDNIRKVMDEIVTMELMAEITEKHQRGGRLLMVTGNYDAIEPVVWNMGRIAELATPESLEMFKTIIEAAIAIPVAFEAMPIGVDGPRGFHTELHGDGGPLVYFYADPDLIPYSYRKAGKARMYAIMNKIYKPDVEPMETGIKPLLERTVYEFTHSGMQSLLRVVWNQSSARGVPFYYTHLPTNHPSVSAIEFDVAYMNRTFDLGERLIKQNALWKTARP